LAKQAVALFVRRVVKEIGALAALLGGVDSLVLTGGIGEHAHEVRDGILAGCAWLGVVRDAARGPGPSACLTLPHSSVSAWMIATDENAVIARHSLALLGRSVPRVTRQPPAAAAGRPGDDREVLSCTHSCHVSCPNSCTI
jgi:acetate kinase